MATSFLTWNPQTLPPPAQRTPITVLCGFLGVGKTTVLNHILRHANGRKIAVLVNDLGDINIDADLIRTDSGTPAGGLLELTSGCICCTIQTELLDALLDLVLEHQPDHIVVESTGVAEPWAILETLYSNNAHGILGVDFLKIANTVTVVDAVQIRDLLKPKGDRTPRVHLLSGDPRRPLEELLMEQLECADLFILSKCDLTHPETRAAVEAMLHDLNPRAEILASSQGTIDPLPIIDTHRYEEEATLTAARWRQEMLRESAVKNEAGHSCDHNHPHDHRHEHHKHEHHEHKDYGLTTFLYQARRPLDEARFLKLMRSGIPGILRAKGFYWSERQPDSVHVLSIAGKILRADRMSEWWDVYYRRGEVTLEQMPPIVKKVWHDEVGDRRQELVFIGIDFDAQRLASDLNACLV